MGIDLTNIPVIWGNDRDTPDDILDAAEKIAACLSGSTNRSWPVVIARALMDERSRNAEATAGAIQRLMSDANEVMTRKAPWSVRAMMPATPSRSWVLTDKKRWQLVGYPISIHRDNVGGPWTLHAGEHAFRGFCLTYAKLAGEMYAEEFDQFGGIA